MARQQQQMSEEAREAFYARLAAENPHPRTELQYQTPFELLVAVVLSAQSTDKGVNRVTEKLFPVANTPSAMLALGEEKLLEHFRTLGLFRNKTKHVIGLSQILVDHHGGEVPSSRAQLEALPGVGRKTANVILNTLFQQPTIAVDTHIFRVANRTGLALGKTVDHVEKALLERTPPAYLLHAHHWLVLHGRYVCQARRPRCASCTVYEYCLWEEKEEVGHAV